MRENSIIVTDSGFGGLLVTAELFRVLKKHNVGKTKITFFNALFDRSRGYNSLKRLDKKVSHFDMVLSAIADRSPKLIIVACNTLSVLYPYTSFSEKSDIPVIEMIQFSDKCLRGKIEKNGACNMVVLATPTTIEGGGYAEKLKECQGDVVEQSCPGLVGAIEKGDTMGAKLLINQYASQASQKIKRKSLKTYLSLNCTHFAYYQNEFQKSFLDNGLRRIEVINPNSEIAKSLKLANKKTSSTSLSIEVFSKTKIRRKFIKFSLPHLKVISPETAFALRDYCYKEDLF